jgi:hypothetical protein
MPLTPTAATRSPEPAVPAVSSRAIATKSAHQTVSPSCSAQPGRGSESWCARWVVATIVPSGRTSTPLELDVPMSTPSRRSAIVVPSLVPVAVVLSSGRSGTPQRRP